ncbi:hypothetical protein [Aquibacillus sediminis]|uniref:hypothetical protein n=1 Tax=Aquibacillus sediminis TaxID=2574734 RepID=UPI00110955FD|nr:hypothetical protein [Aquibacillus sediminis]
MSKYGGDTLKSKVIVVIAILSVAVNVVFVVLYLKGEPEIKHDTPIEVASSIMVAAGNNDNYQSIKRLLHQPYREIILEDKLRQITQMHTGGAELFSYSVVSFRDETGNDHVLLLKLTPKLEDGKIKIQDIKIVPEELGQLLIE